MVNNIEREVEFPFSIERLWRAISEPEELSRWFSDQVTMERRVGGNIRFEWEEYGTANGVIALIEPPVRFAFRWRAHGVPEEVTMEPANSTLVLFELEPTQSGTRLKVTESGFAELPPALREATIRENTSGWESELQDLVTYLAELPV